MTSSARAKRARTGPDAPPPTLSGSSPLGSSGCHACRRDWANGLSAGPAGLIAERVLSDDVAGYVRFRAACTAWRACSADPRAHGVADRRFHPRRWTMVPPQAYIVYHRRRRFLNVVTGELIHVRVPDLRSYKIHGTTAEGLLVVCKRATKAVELLNPLTGQRADYPRLDSPLRLGTDRLLSGRAGLAGDSTLAILCKHIGLVVAKPGDKRWTRLGHALLALPFAGLLYCVTRKSVCLVVEREPTAAGQRQPPRLVVIADHKLDDGCRSLQLYPVYDDDGGLILVSDDRNHPCSSEGKLITYQAKLDTGSLVPVRGIGGRALFVGEYRLQSVSVAATVSTSVNADTVYMCRWVTDRSQSVTAIDLLGGCCERANFDKRDDIARYLSAVDADTT